MQPIIAELQSVGYTSEKEITAELNRRGIPTARSGRWHTPTVHYLLKRIEKLD